MGNPPCPVLLTGIPTVEDAESRIRAAAKRHSAPGPGQRPESSSAWIIADPSSRLGSFAPLQRPMAGWRCHVIRTYRMM
jgi:hypothetical protein